MTPRSLEIRVGITVITASLIVIIGIMWFQRFKLVEKRYDFYVRFTEVGGLTKDDPIMINGVEKGRVKRVALKQHGVLVEMGVKEGIRLPVDSRIALRSIGIMGERFVSVRCGTSSKFIQPGDTLSGEIEAGMSEVMGEAGSILAEAERTASNLNDILEAISRNGKLDSTLANFKSVSDGLKKAAGGENAPLYDAVMHFKSAASLLDSLVKSRYVSVDSSLQALGSAAQKMDSLVANLSRASKELRQVAEKINSGEGTLGRLINDDELLEKLDATVKDLDGLIIDIKKHPGRYLTIRLF